MIPHLYLCWGALDLFYVVRYVWLNVEGGRVPLYNDIVAYAHIVEPGIAASILFGCSLVLTVSIAISAYLFLIGSSYAKPVAYAQVPLRLILGVPSLSFLPWLLQLTGAPALLLNLGLLLLSELLKVTTLYRSRA
ncbi:arginine:ornithine antiporter [Herminiimonas sp. KBW02]|nr:arginine:ornithine antiporter [Herminiimonas sp. KBW02]